MDDHEYEDFDLVEQMELVENSFNSTNNKMSISASAQPQENKPKSASSKLTAFMYKKRPGSQENVPPLQTHVPSGCHSLSMKLPNNFQSLSPQLKRSRGEFEASLPNINESPNNSFEKQFDFPTNQSSAIDISSTSSQKVEELIEPVLSAPNASVQSSSANEIRPRDINCRRIPGPAGALPALTKQQRQRLFQINVNELTDEQLKTIMSTELGLSELNSQERLEGGSVNLHPRSNDNVYGADLKSMPWIQFFTDRPHFRDRDDFVYIQDMKKVDKFVKCAYVAGQLTKIQYKLNGLSITLADETGEITGILQKAVADMYKTVIRVGCVMTAQNVTVFRTVTDKPCFVVVNDNLPIIYSGGRLVNSEEEQEFNSLTQYRNRNAIQPKEHPKVDMERHFLDLHEPETPLRTNINAQNHSAIKKVLFANSDDIIDLESFPEDEFQLDNHLVNLDPQDETSLTINAEDEIFQQAIAEYEASSISTSQMNAYENDVDQLLDGLDEELFNN